MEPPARQIPGRRWLSPAAIWLAAGLGGLFFATANHFLAPPDCASYWAWGESIVRKLSFDFGDSYEHLEMPTMYVWLTPTGHISNDWPMGSGLALAPVIPLGREIAHAWVILWVVAAAAIWLRATSRQFDAAARGVALAAMAVGTPVAFYCLYGPFFSHPISFAVTTAFVVWWDATRHARTHAGWVILGLLLGLAALVRPQNLLLGVVLLPELWSARHRLREHVRLMLLFAGCAAVAFLPQVIVYWAIYGSPFALPKLDEMHWLNPALGKLLTSDFHGLLPWTPVYAAGIVGLLLLLRRDSVLAGGLLLALAVQVYLNAANLVWWSGGSFGNRRLSDSAIIVAYGLAALWSYKRETSWRILIAGLLVLCCGWSLWLLLAERTGGVPLDRYVPFSGPGFRDGMMIVWTRPFETLRALIAPAADAPSLSLRGAAALIVACGALAIAVLVRRLPLRPRRIGILLGIAVFVMICVTAVAAIRTPKTTSDWLIENLPRRPMILWDNFIELSFYELEQERPDRAEAAARRAIDMRPNHYSGWWYLAMSLRAQERWQEAAAAFGEVLNRNPEHQRAGALREQALRRAQGLSAPGEPMR